MKTETRPMLKPWYRVLADDGRVLLEFGGTLTVLEGGAAERLVPELLPLLDGTHTVDEIVAQLGEAIEPAIRNALEALAEAGAITSGPPLPRSVPKPVVEVAELVASTSPAGTGPVAVVEGLARARVGLIGDIEVLEPLATLLRVCGIGSVEQLAEAGIARLDGELDLVVAANGWQRCLEALNAASLRAGVPWMPTLPFDGVAAWIGPLIVPGETCCWHCYRLRRASTSGYAQEHAALDAALPAELPAPPLAAIVAGLAATFALRWLGSRDPVLPGAAWALELGPRPRLAQHVVYRVPRCPVCSGLHGLAAPAPWAEEDAA